MDFKIPAPTDLVGSIESIVWKVVDSMGFRKNRYAVVDPAYTSGLPKVTFEDDATQTLTTRGYHYLAAYSPNAGDRVLMIPGGGKRDWIIADGVV